MVSRSFPGDQVTAQCNECFAIRWFKKLKHNDYTFRHSLEATGRNTSANGNNQRDNQDVIPGMQIQQIVHGEYTTIGFVCIRK